jgi:hypothetical protein
VEHCLSFFYCRYKCEYGPKDFSRIVKPITESLLRKPRKKQVLMETVQEGNTLAPTRRARAKRNQGGQGRKPPRVFKQQTGGSIMKCTNPTPDLNEIPLVMDSPHPLLRPSRKRLPERRKLNAMPIVVCYLRPVLRKAILGCYLQQNRQGRGGPQRRTQTPRLNMRCPVKAMAIT